MKEKPPEPINLEAYIQDIIRVCKKHPKGETHAVAFQNHINQIREKNLSENQKTKAILSLPLPTILDQGYFRLLKPETIQTIKNLTI